MTKKEREIQIKLTLIEGRVELEGRIWNLYTVYTGDVRKTKMAIERMAEREDSCIIVGGDFNARIDSWEGRMMEDDGNMEKRRSKDTVTNSQGKLLCDWMMERGWYILNGNMEEGEEGEFTYVGPRGATVIDYGMTNITSNNLHNF